MSHQLSYSMGIVVNTCIQTVVVAAAAAAAKEGMEQTKQMESLAGRANYVTRQQMSGTPDPGAYAVFLAFQAARSYFK